PYIWSGFYPHNRKAGTIQCDSRKSNRSAEEPIWTWRLTRKYLLYRNGRSRPNLK
ncbi:hypothetical protein MKX01_010867, partial [Papaver californicum]